MSLCACPWMAAHSFLLFLAVSFSPVLPFTHSLWHCLSTRAGNRFFFLYALFPVSVPAAAATAFFISLRTSFFLAALPGTRACSLAASPPVCYQRAPLPVPVSLSLSLSLPFTSATAFDCWFSSAFCTWFSSAQLSTWLASPRLKPRLHNRMKHT